MKKYKITLWRRFCWWLRWKWHKIFIQTIDVGSVIKLERRHGGARTKVRVKAFIVIWGSDIIRVDCEKQEVL